MKPGIYVTSSGFVIIQGEKGRIVEQILTPFRVRMARKVLELWELVYYGERK